jgi:small multidrug resistance pump
VHFIYLGVAIVAEVIGTAALQASNAFTRPLPAAITLLGYGIAFYCLALALKTFPVGIAYAIWSGLGIVLISIIGALWFRQTLDLAAILGLALIIAGVIVINGFSKSVVH